jgi:Glycosidases
MPDSASPNLGSRSRIATSPTTSPPNLKTNSVLSVYRQLLTMRHKEPALQNGTYIPLNEDDPNVLAYLRKDKDEAIMVLLNMSSAPQKAQFNLESAGFTSPKLSVLLTTFQPPSGASDTLTLAPFGVMIAKVTK